MDKERELQEEQAHFAACRQLIADNTEKYQREYEKRHEETARLMKVIGSGDPELYDRAMTSASLEQNAAERLRQSKAALRQPYFGRIDYSEALKDGEERIYIGKHGVFKNRTEVVIVDWRAPVSSVYYENELGEGAYRLPDGTLIEIDLKQKRTYDVQEGKLQGFYDSDVAANDALLVQYLSQNKDVVLGDIIATIQKEQDRIIRESPFVNILVQGVAGSGKTTVAMHRISYILYNYGERFLSNEFCIIGGSDLLLDYITASLPELDVPNIKQKRMDVMLTHLLGKEWKNKKHHVIEPVEDAAVRSKMPFMLELELYLMRLRERYVDCGELRDPQLGVILSAENNRRLLVENPNLSVVQLLKLLEERKRTRLKFLCPDGQEAYLKNKIRQYKDYFKERLPKADIYRIYANFLEEYDRVEPGALNLEEHEKKRLAGAYDVYDLAALLMIQYRITRKKEDEEFGQIFIDEAQDFGVTLYYALRKVLPKCYFTVMGDVSQNINFETGMNDWEELKKWMFGGEKDVFCLLSKSYRNTIEITEYAGEILQKASFGRYRIEPVIRHGLPVQEEVFDTEEEADAEVARIIERSRKKGYRSIAVICWNEQEAEWVSKWIADETVQVLPVRLVKGLEFDVAILFNIRAVRQASYPLFCLDKERALTAQGSAKLLYVAATRALHELYLVEWERTRS
ncbi:MAG: hypothetical protein NC417_13930 [Candidatus Gastranaerophilales bacterium]|nr:hypothetical protein [Candidatus Gastranaerophilales bacterium]